MIRFFIMRNSTTKIRPTGNPPDILFISRENVVFLLLLHKDGQCAFLLSIVFSKRDSNMDTATRRAASANFGFS